MMCLLSQARAEEPVALGGGDDDEAPLAASPPVTPPRAVTLSPPLGAVTLCPPPGAVSLLPGSVATPLLPSVTPLLLAAELAAADTSFGNLDVLGSPWNKVSLATREVAWWRPHLAAIFKLRLSLWLSCGLTYGLVVVVV